MTELVAALVRANLVAAVAILAVIAARPLFRRRFGAETAYTLWLAPPLAVAAGFLPPRVVETVVHHGAAAFAHGHAAAAAAPPDRWAAVLIGAWLIGVILLGARFVVTQRRFLRELGEGASEAAVVGFINPRIVMPRDDGRYSAEERALMRAHEREHIARGDHHANLWIAAFQCLAWFNPLVHVAAALARLDQELACDAQVLRRNRHVSGLYARTLLKAQLAGQTPPLVSAWAAGGKHPLEVRVAALARRGLGDGMTGPILVMLSVLTFAVAAWYVEPPVVRPRLPEVHVIIEQPTMTVLLIRDHSGQWSKPHQSLQH